MMQSRRFTVPLWAVILLLLSLVGAGVWVWLRVPRDAAREVTLYYADAQAMYLVPVSRVEVLPRHDAGALTAMLAELAHAPVGLQATLPAGTLPAVQRISNGQANISLRLPGSMGSGGERMLAGAVVKTAASLDAVREVRLQLFDRQGAPYESQHLDLSAPLSPTDPGVENLYLDGGQEGLLVTLYYATPDGRYLVPLRRALPAAYRSQPLEGSFQLLLAGPPPDLAGILAPSVPAHPAMQWGGVSQGTAEIRWPADLSLPSELAQRALALTLTEFEGVQQVRLSRDGQPLLLASRPTAVNRLMGSPPVPLPATASQAPASSASWPSSSPSMVVPSPTASVYPAP
jgi:spore germination protein GerM